MASQSNLFGILKGAERPSSTPANVLRLRSISDSLAPPPPPSPGPRSYRSTTAGELLSFQLVESCISSSACSGFCFGSYLQLLLEQAFVAVTTSRAKGRKMPSLAPTQRGHQRPWMPCSATVTCCSGSGCPRQSSSSTSATSQNLSMQYLHSRRKLERAMLCQVLACNLHSRVVSCCLARDLQRHKANAVLPAHVKMSDLAFAAADTCWRMRTSRTLSR